MTVRDKFKQGGDWHIRKPDGAAINLNSPQGAQYVLELQARIQELAVAKRSRRKAGPRENKSNG